MEHGFYHPELGYWQTLSYPSEAILRTYPEGTVEVPIRPDPSYILVDGVWVQPE